MPNRTRLLLLRHGEVESRYQRVFGGRIDMTLSPHGKDQARQLADFLRPLHLEAIYASPLIRAQQTVHPLARNNGRTVRTLDGLQEVDFGAWTGLTWDEVREKFGVSAFHWLSELDRGGIPGAEPLDQFRDRVAGCLEEALVEQEGRTCALVCHGGVIRMLLALLLDLPLPKTVAFEIDYASLTIIDRRAHGAEIQLLNYTPWRTLP